MILQIFLHIHLIWTFSFEVFTFLFNFVATYQINIHYRSWRRSVFFNNKSLIVFKFVRSGLKFTQCLFWNFIIGDQASVYISLWHRSLDDRGQLFLRRVDCWRNSSMRCGRPYIELRYLTFIGCCNYFSLQLLSFNLSELHYVLILSQIFNQA